MVSYIICADEYALSLAATRMKSISALVNSADMAANLEISTSYQLDNPISSKSSVKVNQTRRIPRKKVSHKVIPSPHLVECLQKASKTYQAISSTRWDCLNTNLFYNYLLAMYNFSSQISMVWNWK